MADPEYQVGGFKMEIKRFMDLKCSRKVSELN